MTIEVCVSSLLSIKNAAAAGADRVELCSALDLGGLTPSHGLIKKAIDLNLLPIHCLIRPRQGHFFYSKDEIQLIEQNIEYAKSAGCHGIVIGAHDKEFNLDISLLRKWKSLAGSMYTTFHRAFDVLINPEKALNQLIDLEFDCVLTSGQSEKAIDGINKLKYVNEKFGSKINLMPGSGVGIDNSKIFKNAGFSFIHLSGGKTLAPLIIPKKVNNKLSFLNQPIREANFEILSQVVKNFKSS